MIEAKLLESLRISTIKLLKLQLLLPSIAQTTSKKSIKKDYIIKLELSSFSCDEVDRPRF